MRFRTAVKRKLAGFLASFMCFSAVVPVGAAMAEVPGVANEPEEAVSRQDLLRRSLPAYYVKQDGGSDLNPGTNSEPLYTIRKAVEHLAGAEGYIYIMDDVYILGAGDQMSTAGTIIDLSEDFRREITIESTNFDINGQAATETVTIKKANDMNKAMFATQGAAITFSNIRLDGNKQGNPDNDSPMISATGGSVKLFRKSTLQNNKVKSADKGSAIDLKGGSLDIDGGAIINNESNGKGAVNYSSDGDFTVSNIANVYRNTNPFKSRAENVYLAEGKRIRIMEPGIAGATIGVTTESDPIPTKGNAPGTAIVLTDNGSGSVANPSLYATAFTADGIKEGMYVDTSSGQVVLKAIHYGITIKYIDQRNAAVPGAAETTEYFIAGKSINLNAPPAFAGFAYDNSTRIDPATTLSVAADGSVSGMMPSHAVTITHRYRQAISKLIFDPDNGSSEPIIFEDNVGTPIRYSLPIVTRPTYLFDGWYRDPGTWRDGPYVATAMLGDGGIFPRFNITYTAKWNRDPDAWGIEVAAPDAAGSLEADGSGRIIVYETAGGYQYAVVDEAGIVADVKAGSDMNKRVIFAGLYPGTNYTVYEVAQDEVVISGMEIALVGNKSEPQSVLIPAVEHNYTITPDFNHSGKVTLTINPAAQNSKYAVLDEQGELVAVSDADEDGWVVAAGTNPAVAAVPNLEPNREYLVVAVPKAKTGVDPESKMSDGTWLLTDPGVELELPVYTAEAIRGMITDIGSTAVDMQRYEEAKEGELIKLHAEAVDESGNAFAYWKVIIGSADGLSGKVTKRDVEFVMPAANIVVAAYYEKPATPSNAAVIDEVRGGSQNQIALDPEAADELEELLTTELDRVFIDQEHTDITYRVVFDKNRAKTTEKNNIKAHPDYDTDVDKEEAFISPWALDINIERYVRGRKVEAATSSNADFKVYVQLEQEDVDMMDYQLFEVETVTGDVIGTVELSDLPEDNGGAGGLFTFTGTVGSRYVMVYSKAYWVKMMVDAFAGQETTASIQAFKVRKGYPVSHSDYEDFFDDMYESPEPSFVARSGVQYDFDGWSLKKPPAKFREYDFDTPVKKPLLIYAYYSNNQSELADLRKELQELLDQMTELAGNTLLTNEEKDKADGAIAEAQELFDRTEPTGPTVPELEETMTELTNLKAELEQLISQRDSGGNVNKGRRGGSGGNGSVISQSGRYIVGVDGNWVKETGGNWSFMLNSGIRLTAGWSWLEHQNESSYLSGWYYFGNTGLIDFSWKSLDGRWYWLDPVTGKMVANDWVFYQENWYYLGTDGGMVTGWQQYKDAYYYLSAEHDQHYGHMLRDQVTPDGYYVNNDGVRTR